MGKLMDSVKITDARPNLKYILFITFSAALGGFLFGYDTAVISGTTDFLQERFELTSIQLGWAAASALIGCIIGSASAGWFSDRYGRKKILMAAAVLYTVSAVASALAQNLIQLSIARIIGGIGVGSASLLSPLYIAEISPEKIRGRLVTLVQFSILIGMIVVYYVNARIAASGNTAWNVQVGWRWMFGSEAFPAVLFLGVLFFIPETPRWLLKQGFASKGKSVLQRIGGTHYAQHESALIQEALKHEEGNFLEMFQRRYVSVLIIGIGLAVLCQATGINVIMYYAPRIFVSAGLDRTSAMYQTILIGLIQFLFTCVAFYLVDKMGRKICLLISVTGMGLSLAALGIAYGQQEIHGVFLLVCVLSYVASFAIGMGAVPWIVISEIYPNRLRGRAMSLAIFFIWFTNFWVSQLFPYMLDTMRENVFWFYAAMCAITFVFVWKIIPETKGKSLEQIEHELLGIRTKPKPETSRKSQPSTLK